MIKVIELFSGIGSQHAALERLKQSYPDFQYKVIGVAEIDKDATLSYSAIHHDLTNKLKGYNYPSSEEMVEYLKARNIGYDFKKNKPYGWKNLVNKITQKPKRDLKKYYLASKFASNYGDISKIDKLPKADFWTYSFPCQDLSVAGKQKGLGEGTRSGLLYEVERLLEVSKEHGELPTYLMLENVKNLVGKKFKGDFDRWIGKLNELGYNTYWQVLNAKHYGVPQNRERVFAISILREFDMGYAFPEGFDNGVRLKDILEDEVDEKFYISNEKADKLLSQITLKEGERAGIDLTINEPQERDIANCIKARYDAGISNFRQDGTGVAEIIKVGNTSPSGKSQCNDVIHSDGVYPTICAGNHGNANPSIVDDIYKSRVPREYKQSAPTLRSGKAGELKVKIPQATTKGYIECSVPGVFDMTYPDSKTRRGRVQDHGEIVPTLTAASQDIMYVEPNVLSPKRTDYGKAIRKDYESGKIQESRHNMTEMKPREDGISNTLTTVQKDNYVLEPKPEFGRMGKQAAEAFNNNKCKFSDTINPFNMTIDTSEASPTLTTRPEGFKTAIPPVTHDFRIRKLTPKECFRLMGFSDEDFHKAESVNSNSQLYKQAGNSIVVDVLYYLFENLFLESDNEKLERQVTIFDLGVI